MFELTKQDLLLYLLVIFGYIVFRLVGIDSIMSSVIVFTIYFISYTRIASIKNKIEKSEVEQNAKTS